MDERNNMEQQDPQLRDPLNDTTILPDEEAIAAAGLSNPRDREVNQIIREIQNEIDKEETGTDIPVDRFSTMQLLGDDLEEAIRAEAKKPVRREQVHVRTEPEQPAPHKGRPKKKMKYALLGIPHLIATVVWLGVLAVIGVSLGRVIWVCAADVLAFGRPDQEVVVTIEDADTLDTIAVKLQEKGLIQYPELFKLYANVTDSREDISSGTFTLNTMYDYNALVNFMSAYSSKREIIEVMIPEGYTCAQIFRLMEEKGVCTVAELEAIAAYGDLGDYWFLEDVERGDKYCLEGFLFPDTYEFYAGDSAERVLKKLLNDFEYRFDEDLQEAVETLNGTLATMMRSNGYGDDYINSHRMSVRDVVIVASLIEKETAGNQESADIASVIYNRLTNQAAYPYLNIDAALLYAIGHRDVITNEDLQTDTPYNTYLYKGLIPGPIANPGLNSLKAALDPSITKYHYYALDPETGYHHFSNTYEDHVKFLESLE